MDEPSIEKPNIQERVDQVNNLYVNNYYKYFEYVLMLDKFDPKKN